VRHTAAAIEQLQQAVEAPCRPGQNTGSWRWTVRQRMTGVRDLLLAESAAYDNAWLEARRTCVMRERTALLTRLSAMGAQVLTEEEVDTVREQLRRLVSDLERHLQRLSDLAYDEVALEIGGSE
jgi:hypothetical protein